MIDQPPHDVGATARRDDPILVRVVGWTSAVVLLVGALLVATLPLTLAPVAVEHWWPGASWRSPFRWWWVIVAGLVVGLVVGVAGFASVAVEAASAVMFPRSGQKKVLDVLGGVVATTGCALLYALVLRPFVACLAAGLVAYLTVTALEGLVARRR